MASASVRVALPSHLLETPRILHLVTPLLGRQLLPVRERSACKPDKRLRQWAHGRYAGDHDRNVTFHAGPRQAEYAGEGEIGRWCV